MIKSSILTIVSSRCLTLDDMMISPDDLNWRIMFLFLPHKFFSSIVEAGAGMFSWLNVSPVRVLSDSISLNILCNISGKLDLVFVM